MTTGKQVYNKKDGSKQRSLEASPPTDDSPGLWHRRRFNSSLVEGTVAETCARHRTLRTDCMLRHTVTHVA